jgi:cobalamin-dependent methionine synthase I
MLIIGELINSTRKMIAEAIRNRDSEYIRNIARDQFEKGADFIDVNAGAFPDNEAGHLQWLVKEVQSEIDAPCCLDSPDPQVLAAALAAHKGTAMVNSISLEKERYEILLPVISGTDLNIVALCMSDSGMPQTCDERCKIADRLINGLVKNDIPVENIYVDPLVQPVATDTRFGIEFLDAVEKIMKAFPGIHTVCGLSNISFGLPERKHLNRTFVTMAIARGLDAAIVDPLDEKMMANIVTAEALYGNDAYCMNYIKAFRAGKL